MGTVERQHINQKAQAVMKGKTNMAIALLAEGNVYFISLLVVIVVGFTALAIACDNTKGGK